MSTVTLKKSHFSGHVFLMSDGAVSNGHWALKKEAIKNATMVSSLDAVTEAFGLTNTQAVARTFEQLGLSGELHEWTATKFLNDTDEITARIFQSTKTGEFVGLDVRYLAILDLDTCHASVYGSERNKPFVNAPTLADSVFLIMPVRLDPFPVAETRGD